MLSTCEKCGSPLSLPADACQACGHLPLGTVVPGTDLGRGTQTAEPDNNGLSVSYVPPGAAAPGDEARKVEELLEHIARQSHFEERYELRGLLGEGGMGQVHRAYDRILRRQVAVKMTHDRSGLAGSPAVRGQFLKEARIGGRLLHPNLLAVFDLGVNRAGQIYYTMRPVDGASLQHCLDAVDKGAVTRLISYPLRRIVQAFVGVCQGVDYAHQNGVIHLDLKPHNVLVSGFHEVFVIDWGLARVDEQDDTEELIDLYRDRTGGGHTASRTGVFGDRVVGTPAYMAPEQARGAVATFDATTDVYGLGGVLHFILYGGPPNRGGSVYEIFAASAARKARGTLRAGILTRGQRVRQEAKDALDALQAICMRALDPDRGGRYPTAEAMIVELNEWLSHTPGPPAGF